MLSKASGLKKAILIVFIAVAPSGITSFATPFIGVENDYIIIDLRYDKYDEEYQTYLDQANLSDEEKNFVHKIEARMAELEQQRQITSKQGIMLQNPALVVNLHQVNAPSEQLLTMLLQNNMAMEHTNYEQLFQIYESNDYIPAGVTISTSLPYHFYD